jgi:acetyltransferase-like isoleucine patch superfamily enzyme
MSLIERLYFRVIRELSKLFVTIIFKIDGIEYGKNLILFGIPLISKYRGSTIRIGDRNVLCSLSFATALGVNHPIIIRTLATGSEIIIGNDVGISGGSICASKRIEIGNGVMLGANVTIFDTDFHNISMSNRRYLKDIDPIKAQPVYIGQNAFIGANSIVLKGVSIGENSVIGAGSVVTKSIPPDMIAAGNPCKILKSIYE